MAKIDSEYFENNEEQKVVEDESDDEVLQNIIETNQMNDIESMYDYGDQNEDDD